MIGKIVDRPQQGIYIIEDNFGRRLRGQSLELWKKGDWVLVLEGVIIKASTVPGLLKVYEV